MIPPGASSSSVFVPPQMMPPPDRTPRVLPLGGATLHDLTAEDKRKVAKLIKQVVEYADARKKLEAELAEARAEATRESGRAQNAETLAEERKREVDALEAKLLDAFARIKNYRAKIARLVAEAAERAAAGATGDHLEEGRRSAKGSKTDDAGRDGLPAAPEVSIGASSSSRGGPAPSNDLRTNSAGAALSPLTAAVFAEIQSALERTPTERQRPPLGVAPADPRGGAFVATELRRTEKEDPSERAEKSSKASGSIPPRRLPPETPIVPGLSPASARDLRWLARMHGAGDAIFGQQRPNQRTDGRSSAADDVYPPRADAAAAASSNDLRTTSDGAEVGSDPEPSRARPPEPSASRPSARAREPTPELPDEVRVAAALAAGARAAERARAERDEASSEKTRLRKEDASEEKTLLPSSASAAASSVASPHIPSPPPHGTGGMSSCSSEGGGVGAHRVLRFDPARGAAGAFYFGDASFRSGGSGFGFGSATAATTPEEASRACSQRNVSEDTAPAPAPGGWPAAAPARRSVRAIFDGSSAEERALRREPIPSPPTTSASAAKRELVTLDDRFRAYAARAAGLVFEHAPKKEPEEGTTLCEGRRTTADEDGPPRRAARVSGTTAAAARSGRRRSDRACG